MPPPIHKWADVLVGLELRANGNVGAFSSSIESEFGVLIPAEYLKDMDGIDIVRYLRDVIVDGKYRDGIFPDKYKKGGQDTTYPSNKEWFTEFQRIRGNPDTKVQSQEFLEVFKWVISAEDLARFNTGDIFSLLSEHIRKGGQKEKPAS